MEKLYCIEHYEYGIWYFTTLEKAAEYIGAKKDYLELALQGKWQSVKHWEIYEVDAADAIPAYINPDPDRKHDNNNLF